MRGGSSVRDKRRANFYFDYDYFIGRYNNNREWIDSPRLKKKKNKCEYLFRDSDLDLSKPWSKARWNTRSGMGGRGDLWSSNAHSTERQVSGYNDPRIRRSKDRGCTVLRDCKPIHYTNSVSSRMQKANHIVVQANMIPTGRGIPCKSEQWMRILCKAFRARDN